LFRPCLHAQEFQTEGMRTAVIHLYREAPTKPALGEPCNGCGACCATEPCPVGAVMSLRRSGSCVALEWNDSERRYRCGLLSRSARSGPAARRLVSRWIAAGAGCDAELEVTVAPTEEAAESA
jgi:hypothetical protein